MTIRIGPRSVKTNTPGLQLLTQLAVFSDDAVLDQTAKPLGPIEMGCGMRSSGLPWVPSALMPIAALPPAAELVEAELQVDQTCPRPQTGERGGRNMPASWREGSTVGEARRSHAQIPRVDEGPSGNRGRPPLGTVPPDDCHNIGPIGPIGCSKGLTGADPIGQQKGEFTTKKKPGRKPGGLQDREPGPLSRRAHCCGLVSSPRLGRDMRKSVGTLSHKRLQPSSLRLRGDEAIWGRFASHPRGPSQGTSRGQARTHGCNRLQVS